MNFKSIEKWIQGKNVLLLFLMALVVIVIIDCNTKMNIIQFGIFIFLITLFWFFYK